MRRASLKTKIMNKAQKFLLDKNLGDIVLNAKEYPENTPENAKKWIYLSDILEQYLEQNQALRIHDIIDQSEQLQGFFDFYKQKFGDGFNTDVLEITLKQHKETL